MANQLNVAVVGSGPLGTLMAAFLQRGGGNVTLVQRRAVVASERVHLEPELFGTAFALDIACTSSIPTAADVILVAVRAEQLDDALLSQLKAARAKAVLVFSPLLGATLARWRAELPGLVVGMPVLAAEFAASNDKTLHYWQIPSTLVERPAAPSPIDGIVSLLRKGGAWISLVNDAPTRTVANTVALFPFHVAVFRRPHLREWLHDAPLCQELARALARSLRLARQLGPVEPALAVLVWWLSSARRISFALRLGTAFVPGVCAFVERHFGAKLGKQHAALALEIQGLANMRGVDPPLCAQWMSQLPEVDSR